MEARTKFIVYKIAGYALLGCAIYHFIRGFFMYREIADLAVTAVEFKTGMTQAVLKGVAGLAIGFVGVLFNYSANLHKNKKEIDFF